MIRRIILFFSLMLAFSACATVNPPVNDTGLQMVTAVPTLDVTDPAVLCAELGYNWGRDWLDTIRILDALESLTVSCNEAMDLSADFYIAYFAYGTLLEQRGHADKALDAYERALIYKPGGREALNRIEHLQGPTPEPPQACEQSVVDAASGALPAYEPTIGNFVYILDNQLMLSGVPYPIYGVNYYPRDYPAKRFLTEMQVDTIDFELDLMKESGLNTLRIFLRYDDLFVCFGNGAVPHAQNFARLDAFIQQAAGHGYKMIVVLNQDADLFNYPLYDLPAHSIEQSIFIAKRYANEPAVMAYDLRNSGDYDYRETFSTIIFTREQVMSWLLSMSRLVKGAAPRQLITAGWEFDAVDTIQSVDFLSFQHYGNLDELRQEIAILTDATDKPIVLASVGYSTFNLDENGQLQALYRAFEAVEMTGLAGWLVWTAFDYPLSALCIDNNCPEIDGPFNRFGIWNTSYFPKRAIDAVEQFTGIVQGE